MKRIITIGLLILFLASCVTQKRCLQKFPPQIVTKDSIVVKDTTIYVTVTDVVPADAVIIHDSIPYPDIQYHNEATSPSGRVKAKVDISKGRLTVNCKTDSLVRVIDSLVKLKTAQVYHSETKTIDVPVVKKKTPLWAWIMLVGIILYFLGPPIFKAIINK